MDIRSKQKRLSALREAAEQEKPRFLFCLAATFFTGLVAHAYAFFHNSFSHDALCGIYADVIEENWKIALGRFFVPTYRSVVRGSISVPWLIGLLALLWIGLSVYLIVRMFALQSRGVITLLAGIMAVNLTVTAMTATYLYELDFDMFALLAATAAAYLWHRYKWGWLPGMALVALALSIYQAYLSVAIVLVMIVSIWVLLRGEIAQSVFFKGLKGIGMLIGGGLLYLIGLKVVCKVTGIALVDSYNGLASILRLSPGAIPALIGSAYQDWFCVFTQPKDAYIGTALRAANIALLGLTGLLAVTAVVKKDITPAAKGLFLALLALLPLGMNISYILSGGMVHDLMRYSFWFLYLLALLLVLRLCPTGADGKKCCGQLAQCATYLLVFLVIWNNIQFSNAIYLKKNLEQDAALSRMTRVADRLETMPGYVGGETPVVFVSVPSSVAIMPGFEEISQITGSETSNVISYNYWRLYYNFFTYFLNTPIFIDSAWLDFQTDPRVAEMPSFPAAESIQELDGVIVVKMGD